MTVVKAGHPIGGKWPLILLFKSPVTVGHRAFDSHAVFGAVEGIDGIDAMPITAGKQELHMLA